MKAENLIGSMIICLLVLILLGIILCKLACGTSEEQLIEPKMVYIQVWTFDGRRPSGFPGGDMGENGMMFRAWLERGRLGRREWRRSEWCTHQDPGFDYIVARGSSGKWEVHHISINVGNFQRFEWRKGDRLRIIAVVVGGRFFGQVHSFSLVLDGSGEQYGGKDLDRTTVDVPRR